VRSGTRRGKCRQPGIHQRGEVDMDQRPQRQMEQHSQEQAERSRRREQKQKGRDAFQGQHRRDREKSLDLQQTRMMDVDPMFRAAAP